MTNLHHHDGCFSTGFTETGRSQRSSTCDICSLCSPCTNRQLEAWRLERAPDPLRWDRFVPDEAKGRGGRF